MWKEFITPSFIKTLLILGVIIYALIWIKDIATIFQKSGQLPAGYIVRTPEDEKIIQDALIKKGYFLAKAEDALALVEENKKKESNLILNGKKEVQKYQESTADAQLLLWNKKFEEFTKK